MVKNKHIRSFCIYLIVPLLALAHSLGQQTVVEGYRHLVVSAETPPTLIKGTVCVVNVVLKNPENSGKTVNYVPAPHSDRQVKGELPVGLHITNLKTKEMIKTPEPSASVFMDGLATKERPVVKKGQPLVAGEQVGGLIDITAVVAHLPEGRYSIIPVVWLPPRYSLEGQNPIVISVVDK